MPTNRPIDQAELSHRPRLAPAPVVRTLFKGVLGFVLLYQIQSHTGHLWGTAAVIVGLGLGASLLARSKISFLIWVGHWILDCLFCAIGLLAFAWGLRVWQAQASLVWGLLPLGLCLAWIFPMRAWGFGAWPDHPVPLGDGERSESTQLSGAGRIHQQISPDLASGILDDDKLFGGSDPDHDLVTHSSIGDPFEQTFRSPSQSVEDDYPHQDHHDVNPATGLSMVGGIGGVDTGGNFYGESHSRSHWDD